MLDRNSYIPLYVQIRRQLRAMIQELAERGEKVLPGDAELAQRFGVSKMTVRQAVADLVAEGILLRLRGKGTFITTDKVTEQISPTGDFFAAWPDQGKSVTVEVLAFEERPCPEFAATELRLAQGTPVIYAHRRRLADGMPLAIDHRFFPLHVGRRLSAEELQHFAIHILLASRLPEPMASVAVTIEATVASKAEATELQVPVSSPLLVRTATTFSRSGEALWTGRSFYGGDQYRYSITVPVQVRATQSRDLLAGTIG